MIRGGREAKRAMNDKSRIGECGHAHLVVGQDRIGFGADRLARHWRVAQATAGVLDRHDGEKAVQFEIPPGTHIRLHASDLLWAGLEFGPGAGWHRFAILDGPFAGACVTVDIGSDPAPPPPSMIAIE